MDAIPKSDIKSDIRFGDRFDIRLKQTTWIGLRLGATLSSQPQYCYLFDYLGKP